MLWAGLHGQFIVTVRKEQHVTQIQYHNIASTIVLFDIPILTFTACNLILENIKGRTIDVKR